jgi:hypothetical protein
VTNVQVVLNGLTSSGSGSAPASDSVFYTSFYLESPGGQKFELLSCTGDRTDGDDEGDSGSGLDAVNVTIVDDGVVWGTVRCGLAAYGLDHC